MKTHLIHVFAGLGLVALTACSEDDSSGGTTGASDGVGSVVFSTWGEEYIEQQIPAEDFADGWSVHYNKFLVVVRDVTVADEAGVVAAQSSGSKLVDHTKPGVKPLYTFTGIPGKPWTHVSYSIAPAVADTEIVAGFGTEEDKQLMIAGGYSVYVDAVATKGTVTKTFKWGFATTTLYDRCKGELGGKEVEGVLVTNGGTDQAELTIHGDHLFYDDLQSPEAKVRFDAIASADDGDGVITFEELTKKKLVDVQQPGIPYGTGSATGINDLGAYVTGLSRTVGHYRGEGECFASAK